MTHRNGLLHAASRTLAGLLCAAFIFPAHAGQKEAEAAMEKKDYATAMKEWRALADKGNADAQFHVGQMLGLGLGVEIDNKAAIAWYQKAAQQKHDVAAYSLSLAYTQGVGVAEDKAAALEWLKTSAALGFARAQNDMGDRYYYGNQVPQSYQEAMAWYRKAADQNLAAAQYNIGYLLANGEGVTANPDEASKWYLKAAEQGHELAQGELGVYYMRQAKFEEGVQWLNKAAMGGNSNAMVDLGVAFINSHGVPQDLVRAYTLMELAGDNPRALALKPTIGGYLSEAQIKQAVTEALLMGMSTGR
ncbi:MAG: tetratricopeptide repeat protein [Pseudomonadota bacterium]